MKDQLVQNSNKIYDGVNACTSITIHETANQSIGADAQAHANLQTNGTVRKASWHIQVDDTEAIRSFPDTTQCWHAGTDEGNRDSIAVEICVNADGDYNKAFANAAEVVAGLREAHGLGRDDVVQHNHWSGKNCPAVMRLTNRWDEFLNLTNPQEVTVSKMVSPFEGRLTQNHEDSGGYRGHKGMDIAPPLPGQTGQPVYAAFAGTVKALHRGAHHGSRTSTWAPNRTGDGVLVANPDGEGNGYNHMEPLGALHVGDRVEAGQLIGYNDLSGNQSGPHLHFELWSDWRNPNSDYDPQLAFRKFGIRPGSKPVLVDIEPVAVKPPVKPKPKPAPKKDAAAHRTYKPGEVKAIQEALNYAGYDAGPADDDYGDRTEDAVKDYQKGQDFPKGGLHPDGDWGPSTQAHYEWTRRLQNNLNKWAAVKPDLRVDGDLRSATTKAVGQVQRDNLKGAYRKAGGRKVDSEPGPITCRMLNMPVHP